MQDGSRYFETTFDFNNQSLNQSTSGNSPVTPTYFLDLDPETFSHVLSYLRSGVMPLLWNEENGFDYASYAKLQNMADFLRIERLMKWVKDEEYLKAVQHRSEVEIVEVDKRESRSFSSNPGYAKIDCSNPVNGHPYHDRVAVITKWVVVDSKILFDER
jgi:hypothetical protein